MVTGTSYIGSTAANSAQNLIVECVPNLLMMTFNPEDNIAYSTGTTLISESTD